MKFFVFGIDGGSYPLIQKFGNKLLPNLFSLMEHGTFGELNSTTPPHTAPGWASAITGCAPGTHGIYQFFRTQPDFMKGFMGSHDFAVPEIWKILNMHNISTGLVNIPMTYPPEKVDGYMLSWPLSKTLRYSYPKDLLKEIMEYGGHYLPDIYAMFQGDLSYIEEAIEIIYKRVKSVKYLMENHPQDFLMVVFPEVDRISHFYWPFMKEETKCEASLKNAVQRIYQETDRALGMLLEELDGDCIKVVLSDHGFGEGSQDFYLNYYLYCNELFYIKEAGKDEKLDGVTVFSYENKKMAIDWEKTIAYMAAPGSYGVNINLKGRQKNGSVERCDFEAACGNVIELLSALKDVNGNLLFQKVVPAKDVYHGKQVMHAPDIITIPKSYGIMVQHKFGKGELFGEPEQKGMHRKEGFYIFSGEQIKKGDSMKADIEDITPTILHLHGIEPPEYMEGTVIPVIEDEYDSNYSSSEEEEITERLRNLGYL